MKNVHIENSYLIWDVDKMLFLIKKEALLQYKSFNASTLLNRSYLSMYLEWWLHNIGYYLTKPLRIFSFFSEINERFMHIDLQEWK